MIGTVLRELREEPLNPRLGGMGTASYGGEAGGEEE